MAGKTLRDRILEIIPEFLPPNPDEAVTGTKIMPLLQERLGDDVNPGSIRAYISILANDPTSPVAKVDQGHGYYLRNLEQENIVVEEPDDLTTISFSPDPTSSDVSPRELQLEEKFRSIFMRYAYLLDGTLAMHIEHTKAKRQLAGVNKWKFPDVVLLEWGAELIGIESSHELDSDLLAVKRSLGELPFKLYSCELKVDINQQNLRQYFFQCVSNSKWAHSAQLAIAYSIPDQSLNEQLRRLGSSYDVSVIAFQISEDALADFPSAGEIDEMSDEEFENRILDKISTKPIYTSTGRRTLDWEHIRDLRSQTSDFEELFSWIRFCLDKTRRLSIDDYRKITDPNNPMNKLGIDY